MKKTIFIVGSFREYGEQLVSKHYVEAFPTKEKAMGVLNQIYKEELQQFQNVGYKVDDIELKLDGVETRKTISTYGDYWEGEIFEQEIEL